uniref:Translocon-associated protein subunit delta n=1 Tax=Sus scrofa TaxID=9823 RepID=A0A8D0ZYN5_PIG
MALPGHHTPAVGALWLRWRLSFLAASSSVAVAKAGSFLSGQPCSRGHAVPLDPEPLPFPFFGKCQGRLGLLTVSGDRDFILEACVEPQITPSYYTTSDAVISTETVFIVELSVTCKNRVQNMALYADVSGKQFPVTRGQDVGRYQVSWSLDHKSAHAGTYEVRFFDEESYSLLRKAQRNNEDVSVIPPLFTVSVDHRGTWNGPWVSTEVLAAAIGLVIYYLAFSAKSHIQA